MQCKPLRSWRFPPEVLDTICRSIKTVLDSRWLPNTTVAFRERTVKGTDCDGKLKYFVVSTPILLREALQDDAERETQLQLRTQKIRRAFRISPDKIAFVTELAARIARRAQQEVTEARPLVAKMEDGDELFLCDDIRHSSFSRSRYRPIKDGKVIIGEYQTVGGTGDKYTDWRKAIAPEDAMIARIDATQNPPDEPETVYEWMVRVLGPAAAAFMLDYLHCRYERREHPASPADRARVARLRAKLKRTHRTVTKCVSSMRER